jgi:YHS domain-containing protein
MDFNQFREIYKNIKVYNIKGEDYYFSSKRCFGEWNVTRFELTKPSAYAIISLTQRNQERQHFKSFP